MPHTIQAILHKCCTDYADITAVEYLRRRETVDKTYRELLADSRRITAALAAHGFDKSHVAIIGTSSYPWITTYLGIVNGNGVAVPLDAGLPAEDLWELLRRADVACAFCDVNKREVAEGIREHCPAVKEVYLLDEAAETDSFPTWGGLIAATPEGSDGNPQPGDLCTILFTSGTTGKSKGVLLTQQNFADNVDNVYIDTPPASRLMTVLPIHHAFCLTMDWLKGLSVGATVCVNDSLLHLARNIKKFQPRCILMVPLMVETIYKKLKSVNPLLPKKLVAKEAFGGSLEYIFCGGARLDPFYIDELKKYGITIFQGYGMTECAPVISNNGQLADRVGSVGKPLNNCEIRFVDGEIQVRGSSVMQGYYQMPEETAETLKDGWLCTGDLGYLDEDGFLFITGRKKNLIILSNGENISPEELEGKLGLEPLVGEIVVTGGSDGLKAHIYPDPEYVEKKKMNPQKVHDELQKILDHYNRRQPTYKQIVALEVRDQPFVKSSTRKIKRNLVED